LKPLDLEGESGFCTLSGLHFCDVVAIDLQLFSELGGNYSAALPRNTTFLK
jgi:hypothetical protein